MTGCTANHATPRHGRRHKRRSTPLCPRRRAQHSLPAPTGPPLRAPEGLLVLVLVRLPMAALPLCQGHAVATRWPWMWTRSTSTARASSSAPPLQRTLFMRWETSWMTRMTMRTTLSKVAARLLQQWTTRGVTLVKELQMVVPMVLPQRVVTTAVYKRRQRDRTARVTRTVLCTRHPGVLANSRFSCFWSVWMSRWQNPRTHTCTTPRHRRFELSLLGVEAC